jgi:hypothetical protein
MDVSLSLCYLDIFSEGSNIPTCSYVIRYEFVSDELGTIQSRGWAWAQNSFYYLITDFPNYCNQFDFIFRLLMASPQSILRLDKMTENAFPPPRSSDPTCRSDRFRSDPGRIPSESDIFDKKPIGSDTVFVGFLSLGIQWNAMKSDQVRPGFHRAPSNSDEIRTGFRSKGIRQDPIPPLWPGQWNVQLMQLVGIFEGKLKVYFEILF